MKCELKCKKNRTRALPESEISFESVWSKISPTTSSGVLVGRNITLLTQIDCSFPAPPPAQHTPHSAADGLEKERVAEMWTYFSMTKKEAVKYGVLQSAYTISREPVEVVGVWSLAELSRCHQRSEHGRDGEDNGKGWHRDSCLGTGGGDEWAVSRKGEEEYAGRGGSGPFGGPAINSLWGGRGIK